MNFVLDHFTAFVVGVVASVIASIIYGLWLRKSELRFSFPQILSYVLDLVNSIESDEFRPDFVVTIDRNSAIVGGIIAGHIGLKNIIAASTDNKRMEDGSRTIEVVDELFPKKDFMSGKNVLLFICFNDSGTSLDTIYHYLAESDHPPATIRSAALFTSASPKLLPQYYVKKIGVNLKTPINQLMPKMPWVTKSWKHVLARERYGNN